jgi:hypothetical protein
MSATIILVLFKKLWSQGDLLLGKEELIGAESSMPALSPSLFALIPTTAAELKVSTGCEASTSILSSKCTDSPLFFPVTGSAAMGKPSGTYAG